VRSAAELGEVALAGTGGERSGWRGGPAHGTAVTLYLLGSTLKDRMH